MGYFAADRFSGRAITLDKHELALNPDAFISQTDEQVCQTLVHEMVHVWQEQYGQPGSRGYHNKQWAAQKAVGLQPSNTGMVGGKETGQRMSHYIIPNGRFAHAFAALTMTEWKLNLESAHFDRSVHKNKTKFTCPGCGQNAWGKPDLAILCEPCGIRMREAA